jgi:enoyl-[acyl-carrier-protein] reductase (NADH)
MAITTKYFNSLDDLDKAFDKLAPEMEQMVARLDVAKAAQLAKVHFNIQGDIYTNQSGKFDIVVSAVAHNGTHLVDAKVCWVFKAH